MSFILNYYTPFKDAVKEMKGNQDENSANEEVRRKLYEGKLNSYALDLFGNHHLPNSIL